MVVDGKRLRVKRVTISLDPLTLRIIDEERGLVKRNTFIDYLLQKQLLPLLKERQRAGENA